MAEKRKSEESVVTTEQPSLLEEIVREMKVEPTDDGYAVARQGVQALVSELVRRRMPEEQVDRRTVDAIIADVDRRIGEQVDAILHHREFQERESAWRSLRFLVDRIDYRENIRLHLLQVSKQELLADFEDSTEVVTSGLYRHVYTSEYGQFGGKPFGAMIANYEFGVGSEDLALLRYCASVAAMSHAPFLTAASPSIFTPDEDDFRGLPYLKDLDALFEGPRYVKWRSFRDSEDSRYVGLCLPRFLLREPYDPGSGLVRSFNYGENVSRAHASYLWGNAAFALATCVADSFGKSRMCANIIGPQSGGAVEDLPTHSYEAFGDIQNKIPTETLVSERREFELSESGFIALTMRKDSDNAVFFSANSAQKPKFFGKSKEGKEAETNARLGGQLPYLFVISRIAHYIKVMQREHIGSWKTKAELQRELSKWIDQYVIDMDSPHPDVRSARPLRKAAIVVEDVEGNPGWYKVDLKVVPHMKYMGAFFTLSLVGKLDKD